MTEPGGPPGSPPALRPLLHPAVRSLLFVLAFLAAQGVALQVLDSLLRAGRDGGAAESGFLETGEAFVLLYAASLPPLAAITWIFLRFLDRRGFRSLGVRPPRGGRGAALGQAAAAPLGAAALLAAWAAAILLLPDSAARLEANGVDPAFRAGPGWWPASPFLLLAAVFLGFCLQGGIEEWVLRGYVYRSLRERWAPWRAALASSLLFASLHAMNPSVSALSLLNIAIAGFLLAGLAERTGSLWSPTLAHGAWNFAVACVLSLPVSGFTTVHLLDVRIAGDRALTGGAFGPEGSLLLTPLAALAAWGVWRPPRARRPEPGPPAARAEEGEPPTGGAGG